MMLERDQAAMYVLSQVRRGLSVCVYTPHPEQSSQLLFERFQILHANVCTNACKSCIREHSRGITWPCMATAFLLLALSGDGGAP